MSTSSKSAILDNVCKSGCVVFVHHFEMATESLPSWSAKWASELIEIAGASDCFLELSRHHSAKDRTVQAHQVIERQPDIIVGSWCGKKFQPEQVIAREGWHNIPAVKNGLVFEIKSADILQPGPSLITHGLPQLQSIIQQWASTQTNTIGN